MIQGVRGEPWTVLSENNEHHSVCLANFWFCFDITCHIEYLYDMKLLKL